MKASLEKYLKAFKKLRVDRSHGVAPHKPILLISVIQSFNAGIFSNSNVYLTPEFVAFFKANWSTLVTTNHDCRISYPFYYMKSEGFWALIPKDGFSDLEKMGSLMKSFANLKAVVDHAQLETDLVVLLKDSHCNQMLLRFLLDEYFPVTKSHFSNQSASSIIENLKNNFLNEPPNEYQKRSRKLIDQKEDEEIYLRSSVFKREIPRIYNNSCCITGLRVESLHNVSMIDACHIVPFSESYDDTVTNGIAFCPNLHRAFDRGFITITPDYTVRVSDQFLEEGGYSIKQYRGSKIHLPKNQKYWPRQENLEWHGIRIFK
ncbi:HNH endonuclease [Marinoscillum sp. MHG1-6]|uniref:HNH endonuclease n=1 Tax=Marinoscillum sp. MHG1-6 TaxID=2959627 RepID=UPI0021580DB0|nr:HNH endonuclease [Marinoscillum sp. MHG1-6]